MKLYDEKDYVEVVDGDGKPVEGFEHPVPKAWVNTPLLPPGAKAKSRSGSGGRQSSKDDAAKAAEAKKAADAKAKAAGDGGKKTESEGS